jgi:ribosomal protein S14
MFSKKIKDIKLRTRYSRIELNRNVTKFLFINVLNAQKIGKKQKTKLIPYFTKKLDKKISKVKVQRRCVLVNRARVSHRLFGVSRIALREMLRAGVIPGYSKAVW